MQTLKPIVQEHSFWKGIHPEYFDVLAGCAFSVHFSEKQLVFAEHTEADRFYLICSGRAVLETYAPPQGVATIQTLGTGEVLGWSWFFPPHRWHFSARTDQPTSTVAFDALRLREMADGDHTFGFDLAMRVGSIMLQRLQATRLQLLDFYARQ